jgi:ligand-binding sensor domain-containing protein
MQANRSVALACVLAGLALMIAGPMAPGEERLVRIAPPDMGHVTDLGRARDGTVLAGTQDGDLWRLDGGGWSRLQVPTNGQPITALPLDWPGDPSSAPIGTGGGLLNPPGGLPPIEARVSDVLAARGRLVVSTGDGLQIQGNGAWISALQGVKVYHLKHQTLDGDEWIHAGTIGAGIFSAPAAEPADWGSNSQGLPDGIRVFTFAVTRGGRLIAGTDAGAFWQKAPGQPWRPLPLKQPQARLLSMYLDPAGEDAQTLWIGGDQGLWRAELEETEDDLTAPGGAVPIPIPPDYLRFGVSWILPANDGIVLSAGSVYQYGPTALPGWYWVSLLGLALVLGGGWLFPVRRETAAPAKTT